MAGACGRRVRTTAGLPGRGGVITTGSSAPALDVSTISEARLRWPRSGEGVLLVCFVRPLGGPLGRAALHELEALAEHLQVLVIAPCPAAHARAWADGQGSRLPIAADPDGLLARGWGMGRDPGGIWTLRGLSQGRVDPRRLLRLRRYTNDTRRWASDLLPAEILVDETGTVRWAHLACSRLEAPDVQGARRAAAAVGAGSGGE